MAARFDDRTTIIAGERNPCDMDAVEAALKLPWSTGPVEGKVNKLKLIKRSMYGRANIDLLRCRIIG